MKKTGLLVLILALVMSLFVTAMAETITSGDERSTNVQLKGKYENTLSGEPIVEVPEVWHIDVSTNSLLWNITKTTSVGGKKTYEWDVDLTDYKEPTTTDGNSYNLTIDPAYKTVTITNTGNVIVSCSANVTLNTSTVLGSFLDGHVVASAPSGKLNAKTAESRKGNVRVDIDTNGIDVNAETLSGLENGTYSFGTLTVQFYHEGLVPIPEG